MNQEAERRLLDPDAHLLVVEDDGEMRLLVARMLREAGLRLTETETLPDHYSFNSTISNKYAGYSQKYTVLCTVKDAVKLWQIDPEVLAIPLEFAPEPAFFTAFDAMLKPWLKTLLKPTQSTQSST